MSHDLALYILENGLIELGIFQQGDTQQAWRWRLDLLPSYPDVLEMLADAAVVTLKKKQIDRLACTPEALPWASVVALKTRLPLIYSRGRGEAPTIDLVGAYDVGHRACLLTDTLSNLSEIRRVIIGGEKTGFVTTHVLAIADDGVTWQSDMPDAETLLTMRDLVALAPEYLPSAQVKILLRSSG